LAKVRLVTLSFPIFPSLISFSPPLSLSAGFEQSLNKLPSSLETLGIFWVKNFSEPLETLPPNLKKLFLYYEGHFTHLNFLPPSLTTLHLRAGAAAPLSPSPSNQQPVPIAFPPTLHTLHLSTLSHQRPFPISSFPPSLVQLRINGNYNFEGLSHMLPPTLSSLHLEGKFNGKIEFFPPSLTQLAIGAAFKQHLPELPPSLQTFELESTIDISHLKCPDRFVSLYSAFFNS
jgi:hypothetical protein